MPSGVLYKRARTRGIVTGPNASSCVLRFPLTIEVVSYGSGSRQKRGSFILCAIDNRCRIESILPPFCRGPDHYCTRSSMLEYGTNRMKYARFKGSQTSDSPVLPDVACCRSGFPLSTAYLLNDHSPKCVSRLYI